jgi:hypothetical protein
MARSRALTVEDIPQLVDAIVLALERRGMLPGGNPSPGMEDTRCDRMEKEFMDLTGTATDGASCSVEQEAARRLSRFRQRPKLTMRPSICSSTWSSCTGTTAG